MAVAYGDAVTVTSSDRMRAYRMTAWGRPPELVEVPVPSAGAGQAVVRVAGCGLCHSDLAMMAMPGDVGEALGWQLPFTLGHETAGWVHEVGEGVSMVAVGDAVAVVSPSSCGTCRSCRAGHENRCERGLVGRGYGRDGGLADYVLVDGVDRALFALPDGLAPHLAGPLTDAGATSMHAVRRLLAALPDADQPAIVVIGAGGLGAFAIQFLRALAPEAVVLAVDPDPTRRDLAIELGARRSIPSVTDIADAEAGDVLGVLDFVGTDDTIRAGTRALSGGGVFGLVGAAGGTLRRPWYGTLPRDGTVFTFQNSDRSDLRQVLDLAASGLVQVLVEEFRLADVAPAYEALEAGGLRGRILVRP